MEKSTETIEFKGGKKGFDFKLKIPDTYEEFKELFEAFVNPDIFGMSFTLEESKFKKFPAKFIKEETVKEVNNLC